MRLVHVDKNCDMWNFAIEEHLKLNNCSRPKFQPAKEEKRGVVVAQSLRCVNFTQNADLWSWTVNVSTVKVLRATDCVSLGL